MAKSLRSKKKKRLRTLRREIVEPFYDKKEAAKLAAQEAALAAPKLAVITPASIDEEPAAVTSAAMDVEMADEQANTSLKPVGGIGKKKSKLKMNRKKRGKGKGKGNRKIRRLRV
ncbi:uncharacterized protein LOC141845561 [Curcuma longa]|uniref:uncharacterized protein LOC141845561 n=1 Tax=Curcuma longa TaxID=136217 RepID=UPI003D9EA90C